MKESFNNMKHLIEGKNCKGGITYQKNPSKESPSLRVYESLSGIDFEAYIAKSKNLLKLEDRKYALNELTNKIIYGDAWEVMGAIPDGSIDLIITSPPYWNVVDYGFKGQYGQVSYDAYLKELLRVWKECERILMPNGKLCIQTPLMPISKKVLSEQHTRHLKNINNDIEATILSETNLHRFSLYIWQKQTTEKMFGSYPYPPNLYEQNTIEFINVYVKDGTPKTLSSAVKAHSQLSSEEWMDLTRQVWTIIPKDIRREAHPAPFPEDLCNRLIAMYSFKAVKGTYGGDVVLDPFCGSGSTCVAAKRLGRNYIGIDLSQDFCIQTVEALKECPFNTGTIKHLRKESSQYFLMQ